MCGPPLNLVNVFNALSGTLNIDCANNGTNCYFKQETLQQLFGPNGLALSGCRFGECVTDTVMQQYSSEGLAGPSSSLSGGVIAGLAVVGALLLALLGLFLLGYMRQRKARAGGKRHLDDIHPAGLSWSNVSYSLPLSSGKAVATLFKRKNAAIQSESQSTNGLVVEHEKSAELGQRRNDGKSGKLILDNISGTLPEGGLMAILGPSGAGKS